MSAVRPVAQPRVRRLYTSEAIPASAMSVPGRFLPVEERIVALALLKRISEKHVRRRWQKFQLSHAIDNLEPQL